MKTNERISAQIQMPSVAFQQCLHEAVFDPDVHDRFIENPRGVMRAYGVEISSKVTDNVLVELKFAITRAREFVARKDLGRDRFDAVFRLAPPDQTQLIFDRKTGTNRGAKTSWDRMDAVATKSTDHWTSKDGPGLTKVPLLDVATLRKLVDGVQAALK